MRSQLIPECRRERDDVLPATIPGCVIIAKPETHVIEKMAAARVPDFGPRLSVLRAEEDGAPTGDGSRTDGALLGNER